MNLLTLGLLLETIVWGENKCSDPTVQVISRQSARWWLMSLSCWLPSAAFLFLIGPLTLFFQCYWLSRKSACCSSATVNKLDLVWESLQSSEWSTNILHSLEWTYDLYVYIYINMCKGLWDDFSPLHCVIAELKWTEKMECENGTWCVEPNCVASKRPNV